MTPYIDLESYAIQTDHKLLERVPGQLARYYLAFPLAEEDGRVTVVTAYPDNKAGLWVLHRLLNRDIVPVSSSEAAIQQAIDRTYSVEPLRPERIVVWSDDAEQIAVVNAAADLFGQLLGQPVTHIEGVFPFNSILELGDETACSLLVTHGHGNRNIFQLMCGSPVPLLLVRGEMSPIRKVLVVLRGFASDYETISRVAPLLANQDVEVMLLPLEGITQRRPPSDLAAQDNAKAHLAACLATLTRLNIASSLRFLQGNPVRQIITELENSAYDLLVIAAEARGDFVSSVLARIDAAGVLPTQPILIIKPPVEQASHRSRPINSIKDDTHVNA